MINLGENKKKKLPQITKNIKQLQEANDKRKIQNHEVPFLTQNIRNDRKKKNIFMKCAFKSAHLNRYSKVPNNRAPPLIVFGKIFRTPPLLLEPPPVY